MSKCIDLNNPTFQLAQRTCSWYKMRCHIKCYVTDIRLESECDIGTSTICIEGFPHLAKYFALVATFDNLDGAGDECGDGGSCGGGVIEMKMIICYSRENKRKKQNTFHDV